MDCFVAHSPALAPGVSDRRARKARPMGSSQRRFFGGFQLHSYETPEIIALPILAGDAAYLDWALQATERGEG